MLALSVAPLGEAATIADQQQAVTGLRRKLNNLQSAANKATDEYQKAYAKLSEVENDLAENRANLAHARAKRDRYQTILNRRLDTIYRNGRISLAEVIFGTRSFDEFLQRLDLLTRIGDQDSKLLTEMKRVKKKIEITGAMLEVRRRERAEAAKKMDARLKEAEARLEDLQQLYAEKKEELAKMRKAAAAARAASVPATAEAHYSGGVLDYFPVAGAHSFSNDWQAPRVGHLHQGTDIMAASGTPCVAVKSGTVSASANNGSAGNTIYLSADNGDVFYYMHLSGFAVTGGHVAAGTVIGYVGDTGNAQGGAPHLHFEYHPGGGGAQNPYPLLVAADG